MSVTGWPDGEATRSGLAVGDMFGALNAGVGICASLYKRELTGKGNRIDVALVDSIVSAMEAKIMTYFNENHKIYGRWGNKYSASSPYDSFNAKDTTFVIASGTDKHWGLLCDAMGHPEYKEDPRFCDTETRKKNDKYLREVIHAWTADKTAAECVEIIDKAGVPAARIYNVEDVVTDPGIAIDREMIVQIDAPAAHPEAGENGKLTVVGNAIKMPLTPMQYGQAAGDIGADNDEILKELGFTDEQLADFREKKVIN
ncbi:MAG: CoA transferase [Oscillospiraceae bacterium]|nr:CoA transferase [Oscillospiraceae bacterium]